MRYLLRALLAAAVGGAILVWAGLPAAPLIVRLDESESLRRRTEWRGAYHIHSDRSDGTGTVDEIARAASDAGLDFIILTDHGDGTRTPEPARYRSAVLVVDAVEVSTTGGHYVVLGLDRPAPYRLGGTPAEVVDDVRWLGGFGLAAHPDSPRRSLSWRDRQAPVDGLEWFNADSAWRDEAGLEVAFTLLTYPFRSAGSIARLFDRPVDALGWWDAAAAGGRRLVTLAALDAHARLGMRGTDDEEGRGGIAFEVPSYREMFGIATNRVWLPAAPSGEPRHDARLLLDAIESGHSYSVIDPFARPGFLRASVSANGRRLQLGDLLEPGEHLDLKVEVDGPAGAEIRLLHNGSVAARSAAPTLTFTAVTTPGAYRLEVHVPASRDRHEGMPWIVTNALFAWSSRPVTPPAPTDDESLVVDLEDCRPEADPDSRASWEPTAGQEGFSLSYALARSTAAFVALACRLPVRVPELTGVHVEGAAAPVMRVKTQVRVAAADRDLRWGSSVRLDAEMTTQSAAWSRFAWVSRDAEAASPDEATDMLLVIDRRHAASGAHGVIRIAQLSVTRSRGRSTATP